MRQGRTQLLDPPDEMIPDAPTRFQIEGMTHSVVG